MRKRITSIMFVTSLTALTACNLQSEAQEQKLQTVKPTVTVTEINLVSSYRVPKEFVGTVQVGQRANLGFELAGKINALFVDVGDTVAKGQPLAQLDTLLLDTESRQLSAQFEQLDAQLALTKTNLQRQRQLKKKGFSADAEIDSLTSQRDALRANMRELEATLASNTLRKEKSTIYAPYEGQVSERFVSVGDVINMGAPTFTLLSNKQNEARIGIPIKYLTSIANKPTTNIRIGNDSYPSQLLNPGAAVDARSRTVQLRYALPDSVSVISGQLVYLQDTNEFAADGFWIPLTSLTDGLRGTWNVFEANGDGNGGHQIARRSVQVIHADEEKAFVSGPMENGDMIVTDGVHRIVSGQQVNIVEE
ncbi:efflux RND transporter periplasmic adaptor subunit [Enterovibrio sp. ZSDZ35]|uniref:Efflux RND transporter periplasmic adaptor subunit n=1 Tax=Enterovibrio qingdaonensis TaxID=2899818 RepID=A0ABT5QFW3_9GAMM|nr:efflux RND transporter periplasmic adaptor subunit [Enterovibrio sp. ZSDZ35]MDD1779870.1 efflux RND transporter periplasmic adaptor subunit [Enterovibrio sp. ZSDZ35]